MRPLETPADIIVSALVTIRIPDGLSTEGLLLKVRPDMVTVTAALAAIVAVLVAITMEVELGVDATPVAPPLIATDGIPDDAKNPVG